MSDSLTRGMDLFFEDLEKYAKSMSDEKISDVLMVGGEMLAEDVRRLPSPRTNRTGYTHMLDSVAAEKKGAVVYVGWGRYYGRFVEEGTTKMRAQPHLIPTWDANREKYYKAMNDKLFAIL